MADVHLECESCKGQRFKNETLDIKFNGKNIANILEMTIVEAISFFDKNDKKKIVSKLLPLQQVGLGYIQLGQS